MGPTLSDGLKQGIVMIIVCAVMVVIVTVTAMVRSWNSGVQTYFSAAGFIDYMDNFTAMAVYGKPLPMPEIVAALDLYGTPEVLCLQMEDLKGKLDGTPYPTAKAGEPQMDVLLKTLRNYYGKKVYVYVASPGGQLQLCIAELPHSTNTDGADQGWEDK